MSFRGELCRSQWNRGFHPTLPYDDPYIYRPQGRGKRAHTRAVRGTCTTLFVTDALPRHGVVALIQRVIEGVRPKGGVYAIYLPTYPFYITATRRSREYAFEKTVIDPSARRRTKESLSRNYETTSPLSYNLACLARTRFPLLHSDRLLRRLTRRLYNVALTYSLLCIRELDAWVRNVEGKERGIFITRSRIEISFPALCEFL